MLAVRPFPFEAEFRSETTMSVCAAELEREVADLRRKLEDAREEGRRQGAEEALTSLRAERDTALLAATEVLAATISSLEGRFEEVEHSVARLGAELALDIADHLAGSALARDPTAAIEQAIGRSLTQVRRGQPIAVRVSPEVSQAVQALLDRRQATERRRLHFHLVEDNSLLTGDVRLDWDGGSLLLDRKARRAAVEAEIAALLAA